MSSVKQNLSIFFPLLCLALTLPIITAGPVVTRDNLLDNFVELLTQNNCSLPKEVDIPFKVTNSTPFIYLYTPLKECQFPDALKENNKANLLCKEVFDVLRNITCIEHILLPKINSHLSEDICKDFAAIQNTLPEKNEYLSRKLGDNVICKVLCAEKYELLCKTLLWGYDTQAKIKKALSSTIRQNEKGSVNNVNSNKDDLNEKITAVEMETSLENHEEVNGIPNKITALDLEEPIQLSNGSSLSNFESKPSSSESPFHDKAVTNKDIISLSNHKDGKLLNSNNISPVTQSFAPSKIDSQSDIQKVSPKSPLNENIQPGEQSSEVHNNNSDLEENGVEKQSTNIKAENPVSVANPNTKVDSLTTENRDQNGGSNTSLPGLPDNENNENNGNSNINVQPNEKIKSPVIPETETDSGVNNVGLQEPSENETKDKEQQTDLKKQEENSKENFISNGVTSEMDSNILPSTVLPVYSEKNEDPEQHSDVKDPELYNDSENDGDYAKQEYDNGFSPSLKKDSEIKNSVEDGSNQISSSSSIQINPENFPGQGLEGNRNYIPSRNYVAEQEDGHFFFYFLSIVLILMAGYLIFHNKQKIIALIVEGRHERRRRSHGAGYKKLETK